MSAALRLGPETSAAGFGFIEIRNTTIERLRAVQAETRSASYDEAISVLISRASTSPKVLCGALYTWKGRVLRCRKRDASHIRAADRSEQAHAWWAHNGQRVEWRPRP